MYLREKEKYEPKVIKRFENGGSIILSNLIDKEAGDFGAVYAAVNHFASEGQTVELMPKLHPKSELYQKLYAGLKKTKYWGKSPDLKVGEKFYEVEGFEGSDPKRSFKNMFNRGLKQSPYLVVEDCGLSDEFMIRNIGHRVFVKKQNIQEVWVRSNNKFRLVYNNAKTP